MKLYEFEGKALFKQYKIPTPKSILLKSTAKLPKWKNIVLKAQVLQGGRGKAGLIKVVEQQNAKKALKQLLTTTHNNEKVNAVIAEELLDIKQEHYLSIRVDRTNCNYQLIYSPSGGINIEDQKKVIKHNFLTNAEFNKAKIPKAIKPIAKKLLTLFKEKEATLVEINPLIQTPNKFIAADSKVIVDNNALHRHKELHHLQKIPKKQRTLRKIGVHYVPLEGDIAIIGNGAGLVMATIDTIKHYKLKPADFLDVGGSASTKQLTKSMEILLKQKPRAFFINIFGGLTHCDDIAKGIVKVKQKHKLKMPIVVRMIGTNEEQAIQILNKAKIQPVRSLDQGIKQLVKVLK